MEIHPLLASYYRLVQIPTREKIVLKINKKNIDKWIFLAADEARKEKKKRKILKIRTWRSSREKVFPLSHKRSKSEFSERVFAALQFSSAHFQLRRQSVWIALKTAPEEEREKKNLWREKKKKIIFLVGYPIIFLLIFSRWIIH